MDRFSVGKLVIPHTQQQCSECKSWFRFRYDEACKEISNSGLYKVICPTCNKEYVYESESHLPGTYMKFIEVD